MAETSEVTTGLLDYVSYDTQPEDDRESIPSTKKQFELVHKLVEELRELGASQVRMSEQGYVYACIPSDLEKGETSLALGFVAHIDTAPSFPDEDVKPQFIRGYDGQDICPNREQNIWMRAANFPDLRKYEGETPTTTDGITLLGADDKTGVTEAMTMAAYFLRHPEAKHGVTCAGFAPDEEVGRGTDGFDVEGFGADVTYTVDGGTLRELEYGSFNIASDRATVHGTNIHPSTAKGRMRNIFLMAVEFQSLLPADGNPMHTEEYEGFYHLDRMTGYMGETKMDYIVKDHGRVRFEHKKELFVRAAGFLNQKYDSETVEVVVKGFYYNMKEKIEPHVDLIDRAKAPMEKLGVRPIVVPIRGGIDDARPSYMGLSCPDLCTGGHNFHGKYELIPVQPTEKITEPLIEITGSFAETITDGIAGLYLPDVPAPQSV